MSIENTISRFMAARDAQAAALVAKGVEVPDGAGFEDFPLLMEDIKTDSCCIQVSGASVGQVLEVAAVDKNGVPTAWRAVDKSSGGSVKPWTLVKEFTLTEAVRRFTLDGFEGAEIYVQQHLAIDTAAANTNTLINVRIIGTTVEGINGKIAIPAITAVNKDTPNLNTNSATYSNGAFSVCWSNAGANFASTLFGAAYKDVGGNTNPTLLTKITGFYVEHSSGDGRLAVGSTVKIYVR